MNVASCLNLSPQLGGHAAEAAALVGAAGSLDAFTAHLRALPVVERFALLGPGNQMLGARRLGLEERYRCQKQTARCYK